MLWKALRILVLLIVLAIVAFYAKTQKLQAQSWSDPLEVVIYPINADHSSNAESYINELDDSLFSPIDAFLQQQSQIYGVINSHLSQTRLGPAITNLPPEAPKPDAGLPAIVWWSLKFRYWASQNTPDDESNHHRIRVFVHYHDATPGRKLQHSLGLDKGLLSVVHAFADLDQDQQNNIIIAHELLHTVGATDKYDAHGEPVFPAGYADPSRSPLLPQTKAEIMAVRLPLTETTSRMPESLKESAIGELTAREINWLKAPDN